MEKLPQQYTVRGRREWVYKILKREGNVCLVEMHRISDLPKEDQEDPTKATLTQKSFEGYEIFLIVQYPERPRPDGKGMIPAKELPPPDFHWGRYGFSQGGVGALERAEKNFTQLLELQANRITKREKKASESEQEIPSTKKKSSTVKTKKK